MSQAKFSFQPAGAHQGCAHQHHPRQLPAVLRPQRQQVIAEHIGPVADRFYAAFQLPELLILQIGRIRDPRTTGGSISDHAKQQ